ncbi:hypothetical protein QQ045_007887 [Rhodiola kirilowii]
MDDLVPFMPSLCRVHMFLFRGTKIFVAEYYLQMYGPLNFIQSTGYNKFSNLNSTLNKQSLSTSQHLAVEDAARSRRSRMEDAVTQLVVEASGLRKSQSMSRGRRSQQARTSHPSRTSRLAVADSQLSNLAVPARRVAVPNCEAREWRSSSRSEIVIKLLGITLIALL